MLQPVERDERPLDGPALVDQNQSLRTQIQALQDQLGQTTANLLSARRTVSAQQAELLSLQECALRCQQDRLIDSPELIEDHDNWVEAGRLLTIGPPIQGMGTVNFLFDFILLVNAFRAAPGLSQLRIRDDIIRETDTWLTNLSLADARRNWTRGNSPSVSTDLESLDSDPNEDPWYTDSEEGAAVVPPRM